MIVSELVTRHERIGSRKLIVNACAYVGAHAWVEHADHRHVGRRKSSRQHYRCFINVPPLGVDLVRRLLSNGPANVAHDHLRAEIRLVGSEGIQHVEEWMTVHLTALHTSL